MIDWNDLRYVLAVHRAGSLARAASSLGINATTVGRRVSAIEAQVGARLFDRTPGGWVATPLALGLLERVERMEEEALAVERGALGADQRIQGVVRLTATEMLATRFVAPHLWKLRERHPGLVLDLVCTNRVMDLGKREADIALRLSRPREENLVTKRLASIPLGLYAARRYLDQHGRPDDPERSLSGKHVLMFAASRAFSEENDWL